MLKGQTDSIFSCKVRMYYKIYPFFRKCAKFILKDIHLILNSNESLNDISSVIDRNSVSLSNLIL